MWNCAVYACSLMMPTVQRAIIWEVEFGQSQNTILLGTAAASGDVR